VRLIGLLKAGTVRVVGTVEGFDGPDVLLAGGDRIRPDAVIAATGFRRGLEPLVGHLGLIGRNGHPWCTAPRHTRARRTFISSGFRTRSAETCASWGSMLGVSPRQ
jgi:hypothetical protein